ncbi:hypothetical protein FQZ97_1265030 [compost metagenome]
MDDVVIARHRELQFFQGLHQPSPLSIEAVRRHYLQVDDFNLIVLLFHQMREQRDVIRH